MEPNALETPDSAVAPEEPRTRALGALVWRGQGLFPENSAKIVLIASAPTKEMCSAEPSAPLLDASCGWSAGASCTTVSINTNNGRTIKKGARMELVETPDRVGAIGKLRVVADPDTFSSIEPGDVPALVCK